MRTLTHKQGCIASLGCAAAAAALLAGCSGGSTSEGTVTVEGNVPIVYAKRSTTLTINPTNGAPFAAGGDLILREKSSPSAPEHNLTARFTQGKGDASDPEVSYDGKKVVFTMRCPTTNTAQIDGAPACTGRWNIWEYDMSTGGLAGGTYRRITTSTTDDDVDPAYLPGGRGFVFTSNRQGKTKSVEGGQTHYALDEYERERVLQLHTMDKDGGSITQISANASHDRNPVVRSNGEIMFSRWEHVGIRNRFAIFRVKPDGTDMFVLYGAQSPGNSFLNPREMDPKGKYKGFVSSDLMALSRTQEGGSLMFIDAANYSEHNTPANKTVSAFGGQAEVTDKPLNQERGLSPYGRITTPYPLWDGTDRVLLGYRPCEVTRNGTVIPCANLTAEERALLEDESMTREQIAAAPVQDNAPAAYSIYMFDPAKQTFLPVATPPAGFMYVDPVAIEARPEPNATDPTSVDATLAAQGLGEIEVRSVYDTDGLDRNGETMLAASDLPAGCSAGIAKTAPASDADTRAQVADLLKLKNPADAAYGCSPMRFVRATRVVPPQAGSTGIREALGETDFEPQQILGYAPIEPDGSFKLHVPADTPIALTVIDNKGRGIQTHLNWIQVRPGERRTCLGCHSPRRGASINSGTVVDTLPAALNPALASQHQSGETLASLRTRLDPARLKLVADMEFSDVWATGGSARAPVTIRYAGNANAADDLQTPAPVNGFINYPDHIQPLWTRDRGANTCTTCHADTAKLDLRASIAGTGRTVSYEELVLGDPVIDPSTGLPQTQMRDGEPEIVRGAALVETMAPGVFGMARASRLGEILFGENLKASDEARTTHPNPPAGAPDHSTMLNLAEKRLVSEWMDLGGLYYNDLVANGSPVRLTTLSEAAFERDVFPILQSDCASCHQPTGNSGAAQTAQTFAGNRFVLAGSVEGDYNVSLTMISDVCNGPSNALLRRPSTVPHPSGASGQATALLPAGSAKYNTIAAWIASGCGNP
ncbi:hypothetical protein [Piscinibacter sp.]|uniref:HzsA-related protein n=1 Tax=Piscinibacter sp. TaxID=1903157 RepID=UPI0039E5397F